MSTSNHSNRNIHFRPKSEQEETFDLNQSTRQMKLNLVFLFFHILLTICLFVFQNTNGIQIKYSTYSNVLQEPELNINRNSYPQNYSASDLRYRPFPNSEVEKYRLLSKEMFYHGYDNYMRYAFPLDELNPVECTGRGPDTNNP